MRASLPIAGVGVLLSGLMFAAQDPTRIDDARTLLEQLVETRRQISKEKANGALGTEALESQIALREREIASLRERIAEARTDIGVADEKRSELFEENEALEQSSQALSEEIKGLEERTKQLLARLPEVAEKKVGLLAQRIPADPAHSKLSLGSRYENVVGILNSLNKFQRDITVESETRELGDGTTASVKTLYIGLGAGYYATDDGKFAGVGRGASEGWVWEPRNEAAEGILAAVEIQQGGKPARYVGLPVEID